MKLITISKRNCECKLYFDCDVLSLLTPKPATKEDENKFLRAFALAWAQTQKFSSTIYVTAIIQRDSDPALPNYLGLITQTDHTLFERRTITIQREFFESSLPVVYDLPTPKERLPPEFHNKLLYNESRDAQLQSLKTGMANRVYAADHAPLPPPLPEREPLSLFTKETFELTIDNARLMDTRLELPKGTIYGLLTTSAQTMSAAFAEQIEGQREPLKKTARNHLAAINRLMTDNLQLSNDNLCALQQYASTGLTLYRGAIEETLTTLDTPSDEEKRVDELIKNLPNTALDYLTQFEFGNSVELVLFIKKEIIRAMYDISCDYLTHVWNRTSAAEMLAGSISKEQLHQKNADEFSCHICNFLELSDIGTLPTLEEMFQKPVQANGQPRQAIIDLPLYSFADYVNDIANQCEPSKTMYLIKETFSYKLYMKLNELRTELEKILGYSPFDMASRVSYKNTYFTFTEATLKHEKQIGLNFAVAPKTFKDLNNLNSNHFSVNSKKLLSPEGVQQVSLLNNSMQALHDNISIYGEVLLLKQRMSKLSKQATQIAESATPLYETIRQKREAIIAQFQQLSLGGIDELWPDFNKLIIEAEKKKQHILEANADLCSEDNNALQHFDLAEQKLMTFYQLDKNRLQPFTDIVDFLTDTIQKMKRNTTALTETTHTLTEVMTLLQKPEQYQKICEQALSDITNARQLPKLPIGTAINQPLLAEVEHHYAICHVMAETALKRILFLSRSNAPKPTTLEEAITSLREPELKKLNDIITSLTKEQEQQRTYFLRHILVNAILNVAHWKKYCRFFQSKVVNKNGTVYDIPNNIDDLLEIILNPQNADDIALLSALKKHAENKNRLQPSGGIPALYQALRDLSIPPTPLFLTECLRLNALPERVVSIDISQQSIQRGLIAIPKKSSSSSSHPSEAIMIENALPTPPKSFFGRHPVLKKALIGGAIGLGIFLVVCGIAAAALFSGGVAAPIVFFTLIAAIQTLGITGAIFGAIGTMLGCIGVGAGIGAAIGHRSDKAPSPSTPMKLPTIPKTFKQPQHLSSPIPIKARTTSKESDRSNASVTNSPFTLYGNRHASSLSASNDRVELKNHDKQWNTP
ncbi:MAG: hypothetical protein A3E85_06100 [Gammaproteobacteria bacterium RIFCSPHIGHO2_12_FULL_45_12]|nr:MAG: hypothetical protein A3E85_06100 [Gammaproteobacteria bacterium RIFCSPHIGHO2_12_FULL_45_12]